MNEKESKLGQQEELFLSRVFSSFFLILHFVFNVDRIISSFSLIPRCLFMYLFKIYLSRTHVSYLYLRKVYLILLEKSKKTTKMPKKKTRRWRIIKIVIYQCIQCDRKWQIRTYIDIYTAREESNQKTK